MDGELYSIISTTLTFIFGGGWFLHWRASRRKMEGEAKQTEAQANKEAQEYYNSTLADVNNTLKEVRAERDHYKDDRNALRQENETMIQKYKELQNKLTEIEVEYKREIARLGRRLDCLSPLLCGVVGCPHRKKVSVIGDEVVTGQPQTEETVTDATEEKPSDIEPIESHEL